jgi:hypothetical protein|tara:strand:+ start:835 stop:1050 length:216 start_codon:yes stop_codon:yes gene_type:complete
MAKKYVFVRMPLDTFEGFKMKKLKMQEDIKDLTGKNVELTMPKVFKLVSQNPVEIDKDYLVKFAKLKRGYY